MVKKWQDIGTILRLLWKNQHDTMTMLIVFIFLRTQTGAFFVLRNLLISYPNYTYKMRNKYVLAYTW